MEVIRIENISKSFNGNMILNDISLTVEKGEVVSIIGPSGAGKSTLLRLINGLETLDSGNIYFEDKDILNNEKELNKLRTKIGFVFQSFNLFNNLSVLDNCTIALRKVLKIDKDVAEVRAKKYLAVVGMQGYEGRDVNSLSGGQKQRVAIARCLAMEGDIILFDEPTSSLDPENIGEVLQVIKKLVADGYTMMIVTHEMRFAKEVSSRILFMDNGIIVEDSTPEKIFSNPSNERTRQFLSRFIAN